MENNKLWIGGRGPCHVSCSCLGWKVFQAGGIASTVNPNVSGIQKNPNHVKCWEVNAVTGWAFVAGLESCYAIQVCCSPGCGLVPPGVDVCIASYINGGWCWVLWLGWNFQDSIWHLRSLPIIWCLFFSLVGLGKSWWYKDLLTSWDGIYQPYFT